MARIRNHVMPNGNFKTSKGIHQYAIVATTTREIQRKTNEFHDKVFNADGQILDEQRTRLPQGSTYILFTYEI